MVPSGDSERQDGVDAKSRRVLEACEGVEIIRETCAPAGEVPAGCSTVTGVSIKEWEVIAVNEQALLPDGSMVPALVVRSTQEEDGQVTTFTWARGIGKVRKVEGEETDELVDYCIPTASKPCGDPPSQEDLLPSIGCIP